jgi:hypothetical protein
MTIWDDKLFGRGTFDSKTIFEWFLLDRTEFPSPVLISLFFCESPARSENTTNRPSLRERRPSALRVARRHRQKPLCMGFAKSARGDGMKWKMCRNQGIILNFSGFKNFFKRPPHFVPKGDVV